MVLDHIILGTAIGGSVVAAAYDLKTTEVPNWVFYAMLLVGVPAVILKMFFGGSFGAFAISGITGLGLLGFGYLMYRFGQWGGADMVLLAMIGFLIPSASIGFAAGTAFPFGISFLFNVFLIGVIYMIGYAAVFALRDRAVIKNFRSGLKASSKMLSVIAVSVVAASAALALYMNSLLGGALSGTEMARIIALPSLLTVVIFVVYKFSKSVETFGFRKKIPVSKLKVGDMLLDERRLVGISQHQVNKVKRSGKRFVWIKDGVRFAPAFPLALLFTLYVGDAIFLVRFLF